MESKQKLLETFVNVGLSINRSLCFSEPLYRELYQDQDNICFNAVIFVEGLEDVWSGDLDLGTPRLDNWDSQHVYSMEKLGKKKDKVVITKTEVTGDRQALQKVANGLKKSLYILSPQNAEEFQSETNLDYSDVAARSWQIIKPKSHTMNVLQSDLFESEADSSFLDYIKTEGDYKNGLKHGTWIQLYQNGQKYCEETYDEGKKIEIEKRWYENGKKQSEIPYKNDKMNGVWHYWHNNGKKKWEATYKNGIPNGSFIEWYKNGNKKYEGKLKDIWRVGEWIYYNEDGTEREVVEPEKNRSR